MLRADTEVRVAITVGGEGLEINDLAAWAFEAKSEWTEQVLAQVLWQMQEVHVGAVLAGDMELACPGCGVIHGMCRTRSAGCWDRTGWGSKPGERSPEN